jgi:hypothetical protein
MTPQERELLTGFLGNLTAARAESPDAEADRLIREAMARQPQAAYLLVQQALVQQLALREAQARVAELEQQVRARPAGGAQSAGFLDGAPQLRGAPMPAAPAGWTNPPAAAGAPRGSGVGDFLRSAAATAAGVAGGALLFQGIEGLFGGHHTGLGGGFLGGTGPEVVENTTVINEYADPSALASGDADRLPDPGAVDDADFGDDGSLLDPGDDSGDWV